MTKFEGVGRDAALALRPAARCAQGYLEELEIYLTEVRPRLHARIGIDYNLIRTSDYLDAVLSKFLYQRMSTRGQPGPPVTELVMSDESPVMSPNRSSTSRRFRHSLFAHHSVLIALPRDSQRCFPRSLNPLTIIAGSALVLTPIIIHLINRIRFRRVKWAAMEFLLKAQKRMRRRKILEQLLLLFLRCLLVFLVGLLFARYIGGGCGSGNQNETRPTTHIVILDDTPSMADVGRRDDGGQGNAFEDAKKLIYEKLMPATAEATTSQTMHVIRLSELEKPFPASTKIADGKESQKTMDEIRDEAKVQAKSIAAMEDYLRPLQPSTVRTSLADGLKTAKELLNQRAAGNTAQMIHIVSDLRATDWTADGSKIGDLLKELKESGVQVHLIDVGSPARKPDRKSPPFNDNIAIVELKPRNRVVSVNQQTELEVRVKNFGSIDIPDVRIDFYLNGRADEIPTIQIPSLPAKPRADAEPVQTSFKQTGSKDKPLERFNIVTAVLAKAEPGGLAIDNSRHAVVEVRDTLKVLVVDGRTMENAVDLRQRPEGDSYFLRKLLNDGKEGLGLIHIDSVEFGQLDKIDLRPYASVYLMNVPTLSEQALKHLEKYVTDGGGVGVFLGKDIKPDDYTNRFYRGSKGFFPMPLAPEPSKELTDEQKLGRAFAVRVLLRQSGNKQHPALRRIYTNDRGEEDKTNEVDRFFYFANIDMHWPVPRMGAWREDASVQELYCLPNEASIAVFQERAEKLVTDIKNKYGEAKFEAARKYIDPLLQSIRECAAQSVPLVILARYLDQLICDTNKDGHESEPILREFWNNSEMAETKKEAQALRDEAKYGEPLYIVKQFGRGRVAVMTTDAGGTYTNKKQWTDWPSGKGAPGWAVVVGEMQRYLSGGGEEVNNAVGTRYFGEFDFTRYEPTVQVSFLTADTSKLSDRKLALLTKDLGKVTMDAPAHPAGTPPETPPRPFQLKFTDTRAPGIYMFTLIRKKDGGPAPAPHPARRRSHPTLLVVTISWAPRSTWTLSPKVTSAARTRTNSPNTRTRLHSITPKTQPGSTNSKQKPTDMSKREVAVLAHPDRADLRAGVGGGASATTPNPKTWRCSRFGRRGVRALLDPDTDRGGSPQRHGRRVRH